MAAVSDPKPSSYMMKASTTAHITNVLAVKFGSDVLPPILNALETKNGDQKLVLEVAVSSFKCAKTGGQQLSSFTATFG